ncbi:deoxyribonuclease IV [Pueribacillus sp. YX66]|uniref:deoxyribonuclease IV n=1 Tax=Pueribacillus sp. YX66 TaxID=3229242 RepID=UPI00358D2CB6
MKFGCHLSIKEGYIGAAKRAEAINASAFQYFSKNPKSLSLKQFDRNDTETCKLFCEKNNLLSVAHSPYPTSLTPSNNEKRKQIIHSLLNDLEIAEACGSIGVVVHFGKRLQSLSTLQSYKLIIDMLNDVLSKWEGKGKLILENNAGFPGAFGTTLEELTQIRKLCDYPEKVGFCFDTCHAFSCGLWDGENWSQLFLKGVELDYFEHLEVVHFNNSNYATRSGKDRHALIFGAGYIKENQFDQIVKTPQLNDIPFILETPKEEVSHAKEIMLLQKRWGKHLKNN